VIPNFKGFSEEIFLFLADLKKNNSITWFHKNKDRYQNYLVTPSKSFISAVGPFLNRLNPAIRTEPKFNHTIMRLNKDMRFNKGEPYRPFLLIHFGRFKLDSEFYLYFNTIDSQIGLFINNTSSNKLYFKQNLKKYPKDIEEICNRFNINNNFSLSDLEDEGNVISSKFNFTRHYDTLKKIDYILIHQSKKIKSNILYSDLIIDYFIKMVSQLYPLYCFAISPQPFKELKKFEDNFGEII
jgi:uncharacterized protein (DUF2461 family)